MPGYNINTNQSQRGYFKIISIIHLALLAGQAMFAIMVFILVGKTGIDIKDTKDPFIFVVPLEAV
jgi:hypothetical protein